MNLSLPARSVIIFAVVCLAFLSGAFSIAEENVREISFVGIVTGNRVNIRALDNTGSEVVCQMNLEERVNVVGQRGKWYKVELPSKALVYIHKSNLLKKNGEGIVSKDRSIIRAAATPSSSVLGRVDQNLSVKITKEYLDWYEIEAPKGAYGWVSSDYIKTGKEFRSFKTVSRPEKLQQLNETYNAELKKPLREIELNWILEEYKRFAIENKGSAEEEEALRKIEEIKLKIAESGYLKAKEEYEAKVKNISSPRPGEVPLASGLLANVGKIPGRLSQFKLVKDGEMIGYLTSKKVDLNRYVNFNINIWGVRKQIKGTALFEVDALEVIR